jgi:hypothetical protein
VLNSSQAAAAITAILRDLPGRMGRDRPNSEWTRSLKEEIGNLGVRSEWKVSTSGFSNHFEQEWLYDLTWFRNDAEGYLCDVGLVLESEWEHPYASIKQDFEKLLLAKSPLKVMVFEGYTKNLAAHLNSLKQGISAFRCKTASEIYILAALNIDTFTFEIAQVAGG